MRKIRLFVVLLTLFIASLITSQIQEPNGNSGIEMIPKGFSFNSDWFSHQDRLERLDLLHRILGHIQESYVEPSRVDPQTMFKKVLDEISQLVPEVRVLYPEPNRAVLMVDTRRMEFDTNVKTLYGMQASISDALRFVRDNKKSDISEKDLEFTAINGLLSTLDPHSVFLTSDMYSETKVGTSGKFGGLGIVIGIRDSKLTIIAPLDDTPAFRAGLKSGDYITKIGDEPTTNMGLNEAVNKMRGPKGSRISITVMRKEWTAERSFSLMRDIINVASVDSDLLPQGIGLVRIKSFQGNTSKDLNKQLDLLRKKAGGSLNALILDLRNNPGGLLDQAILVSDKFLSEGTIVTTVGAGSRIRDEEKASASDTEPNYPMAVLVDQGSASASEIVAGALKHRDRAIIIGQRTFGKGTVQSLFELPEDSALKLTIAQYLTPGDFSIQSIGIAPDFKLVPAVVSKDYIGLNRRRELEGEASLERHFANPQNMKDAGAANVEMRYLEKLDTNEDAQFARAAGTLTTEEKLKEPVLRVAYDLLKGHPNTTRKELLSNAKSYASEAEKKENQKIQAALLARGIDWSASMRPAARNCGPPTSTWKLQPAEKNQIKAGGDVHLYITLTNPGPCTLYQASAETKSKIFLFDNHEFLFGKVQSGAAVTRDVKITIPKAMPNSLAHFDIKFEESQGLVPKPKTAYAAILGIPRPRFAFTYDLEDTPYPNSKAKKNGLIERGESVLLKMRVKNAGESISEESSASLKPMGDSNFQVKVGRAILPKLKPGEEKTISFKFDVPTTTTDRNVEFEASIIDPTYRVGLSKKISLDIAPTGNIVAESSLVRLKHEQVPLFEIPSRSSDVMAVASAGILRSPRKFGEFTQVDLPLSRRGWVLNSTLDPVNEENTPVNSSTLAQISWKWFEPPKIAIPTAKLTQEPIVSQFIELNGSLLNGESAKDLYILVNGKKVYYRGFPPNQKSKQGAPFETTVPLDIGMNRIVFVGRNTQDISSQETIVVEREPGAMDEAEAIAKAKEDSVPGEGEDIISHPGELLDPSFP